MTSVRSLDGADWELKGFLGREAAAHAAEGARPAREAKAEPDRGWRPAHVPGSVVDDLWRAGEVPDPYVGRSSLALEWVPERAWLYRRRFELSPLPAGERARLRFEGVDHACEVFVDGRSIGRHEGMFVPFEVELHGETASPGEHVLAVLVEPAPESEPQVGRTSRVLIHKARMTYGWDFSPRMVHQGIWRNVFLEIGDARIRDIWARSTLAPDLRSGELAIVATVGGETARRVRLRAALWDAATRVAEAEADAPLEPGRTVEARIGLAVDDVRPWWPNGLGEAHLYRLVVTATDERGSELDERALAVGFRTLELAPNVGAPARARGYTLVANRRSTYVCGWNWVPIDALYGVPRRERLGHLLRLAESAHVNMLRVWGGGLLESGDFYDECDRRGILVWQEWSQSSSGVESTPSDDPAFVATMARDAEAIVPRLRNHPSLAIWGGGNELADGQGPLDEARSPVLAALRGVVTRLDPGRAWLPTSPTGPAFLNRLDVIRAEPDALHDVHGPWEHQGLRGQQELYDAGTSLLNSEFGVEGMANRRTLEALVPPADRWPPTRDNPVYRHLGDWWINEPLVQACFGGRLADLASIRRASQLLQADGLRYAVEANRRRWPRNSGSLPWQLDESYPNAWCTSAVDHRGDPKPAYHAVAHAYEPVHACARFERTAWAGERTFRATVFAWSSVVAIRDAQVSARLVRADGRAVHGWTSRLDLGDVASEAGRVEVELAAIGSDVFALDLAIEPDAAAGTAAVRAAGAGATARTATNRYLFSRTADLAPLLDLPAVPVSVRCHEDGDAWRVELVNGGGALAVGLSLLDDRPIEAPGWVEPSTGGLHLLPGEARTIDVRWADAPRAGRRLRLDGWNLEDRDGLVVR